MIFYIWPLINSLPQTLMNVRKTLTTDAPSSVTTTSEGTTAPVAMVTIWTRTNTHALVQIILLSANSAQTETNQGRRPETQTWSENGKIGKQANGGRGGKKGGRIRWDCVTVVIMLSKMMMVMTMNSYLQHSELFWGSVRAEQRWHIQSLLACFICRECRLSVHPVRGGPPAAGAPLPWRFRCGAKPWWSMHRCTEGRCWVRIFKYHVEVWLSKTYNFTEQERKRKFRQKCWNHGFYN